MKLHYTETSTAIFGTVSDETNPAILLTRSGTIHEQPTLHNGQINCYSVPTHAVNNGMIYKPSAILEFKQSLLDAAKSRHAGTELATTQNKKATKKALTKEERRAVLEEAQGIRTFTEVEQSFINLLVELLTTNDKEFKLPDGYKDVTELKQEKFDLFVQENVLGFQFDSVHDWVVSEREALEYKDTLQRVVSI
jgi:hypothetical protein